MKKFIIITTLLTTTGLAGISYADCTQLELANKNVAVLSAVQNGKIAMAEYMEAANRIPKSIIVMDQTERDKACQAYDILINKYNLPALDLN